MTHPIVDNNQAALRRLAELGDDALSELLEALSKTQPALHRKRFAARVADTTAIPIEETEAIVHLLFQAYAMADYADLEEEELATDLRPEIEAWVEREGFESGEASTILNFLEEALSLHTSVGVTAKAADLWFDQDRVYCSSRTITDLRPVFQPKLKGEPSYFLPIHTLRLTFHPDGEQRTEDVRIALTFGDILQLKDVLERAISKEEQLVELADADGVKILSDASPGEIET